MTAVHQATVNPDFGNLSWSDIVWIAICVFRILGRFSSSTFTPDLDFPAIPGIIVLERLNI